MPYRSSSSQDLGILIHLRTGSPFALANREEKYTRGVLVGFDQGKDLKFHDNSMKFDLI
jgi:hypothetical protein